MSKSASLLNPGRSAAGTRALHSSIVGTLLAAVLVSGCATHRPASRDEAAALVSSLRLGDVITCETHLGRSRQFTIRAIEDGWLIGDASERVFLPDVKEIKVWRHALGDAALHTAGSVVTLGALGLATRGFTPVEGEIPGQVWRGLSARPSPSADNPRHLTPPVKIGETITCVTRYGPPKTFKVTAIEQGWLLGDSERVYLDDITRIETTRPAKGDGLLLGGLLLATAIVLCNVPLGVPAAAP